MTRVLVAAASAVVRAGLERIVEDGPHLQVVGTASSADDLGSLIEHTHPDVVLVDLDRAGQHPASGLLALTGNEGAPAVVILVTEPDSMLLADTLRLGARAILPRESAPEEIRAAVDAAAVGLVVLHVAETAPLLPLLAPVARPQGDTLTEHLTPREVEVLGMLAEGAGNKLIARRLGISEHTVKFHVGSILAKLNASSRTEAVTQGLRQGLIMV